MSRAQKRNIQDLENIIENNLKNHDFTGTWSDMTGQMIPNTKTGGFWDHLTEMLNSYKGLEKIKRGLSDSLQNPNLSNELRDILQSTLNKANRYIEKIESLFETFGGMS